MTACPEKEALAEAIKHTISSLLKLNNAELEAVIDGDFSTRQSTQTRQKKLRKLKDRLEERLRVHVADHGC